MKQQQQLTPAGRLAIALVVLALHGLGRILYAEWTWKMQQQQQPVDDQQPSYNDEEDEDEEKQLLPPQAAIAQRTFRRFDTAGQFTTTTLQLSPSLPHAVPLHRRLVVRKWAENRTHHLARRVDTDTLSLLLLLPQNNNSDNSNNSNNNNNNKKKRRRNNSAAQKFRVPRNVQHNFTTDRRLLYIYNPSILPLYNAQDEMRLRPMDHQALVGNNNNSSSNTDNAVKYVATFRANTGGNCFGPTDTTLMKTGEQINYLVVSLLNVHLQPIQDVLIDINAGPTGFAGMYGQQFFDDCRILLMRQNLYLSCKARFFRIRITATTNDATTTTTSTVASIPEDQVYPYTYPNIYGNGLTVSLLSEPVRIDTGKNFNVFVHRNDYYLQTYPLPHVYRRLQVPAPDNLNEPLRSADTRNQQQHQQQQQSPLPRPAFDGPDTAHVITTCPANEQPHTWVTNCTDAVTQPFFPDHDHGTACCVNVVLNQTTPVRVGISHTKTTGITHPWWNRDIYGRYNKVPNFVPHKQYLSRFVAYDTQPPFAIVARSGWFCLSGGGGRGAQSSNNNNSDKSTCNPLAGTNQDYKLNLFNDTYNCPAVHFASGFSEVVHDPTKAIIAYGINDCYPMLTIVSKSEIAEKLSSSSF